MERKELMSGRWGGAYIGTAHVTSGTDDDDAEPLTPPTGTQRYYSRFPGSSLMPGNIYKVRNLQLDVYARNMWQKCLKGQQRGSECQDQYSKLCDSQTFALTFHVHVCVVDL